MSKRDYNKSTTGTRDDSQLMRKVAEEMNEVMGLEPPLPTNPGRDGDSIYKEVVKESKEINLKKDTGEFSDDVQAFLEKEGLWPGTKKSKKDRQEPVKDKTNEKEGDGKMAKKSAKKKKKTGKKSKAKAVAKKSAKKSSKATKSSYTRSDALVSAFKKGGTKKQMVKTANDLYVKNGGGDNENVSTALLGYVLPSLLLLDVVILKDNKYNLA